MNQIQMDPVQARKADEYVERFGVHLAIEKLSILAAKKPHAQQMLNYIRRKHIKELPRKQPVVVRRDTNNAGSNSRRDAPIMRKALEPKEKFLNMINRLDIDPNSPTDGEFHPVIDVEWKEGNANINGFNVNFPSEDKEFMFAKVKSRRYTKLQMTILGITHNGVIARPDVDEFYRRIRQKRREQQEIKKFCGTVIVNSNGYVFVRAEQQEFKKKIIIPKRNLGDLRLQPGKWMFRVIADKENEIVAVPVEEINERNLEITQRMHEYEETQKIRDRPVQRMVDSRLEQLKSNGSVQL